MLFMLVINDRYNIVSNYIHSYSGGINIEFNMSSKRK